MDNKFRKEIIERSIIEISWKTKLMILGVKFFKFFFMLYASLGFFSLTYIAYLSTVHGSVIIYNDFLKPYEIYSFSLLGVIFLLKGLSYVKAMLT